MMFWGVETKKVSSKNCECKYYTCKSWHCQETRIKVERKEKITEANPVLLVLMCLMNRKSQMFARGNMRLYLSTLLFIHQSPSLPWLHLLFLFSFLVSGAYNPSSPCPGRFNRFRMFGDRVSRSTRTVAPRGPHHKKHTGTAVDDPCSRGFVATPHSLLVISFEGGPGLTPGPGRFDVSAQAPQHAPPLPLTNLGAGLKSLDCGMADCQFARERALLRMDSLSGV
jgi:hypothetical protein